MKTLTKEQQDAYFEGIRNWKMEPARTEVGIAKEEKEQDDLLKSFTEVGIEI
jgi:hypothetical protein